MRHDTSKPLQINRKTRVFISYARVDSERIDEIYSGLKADQEIEVFLDKEDILPGEDWQSRLEALIRSADAIVFALSPESASSDVCAWEMSSAEQMNKRIIPLIITEPFGDVPANIQKLNYIFARPDDDGVVALENLRKAITQDIDWLREHTRLGDLADRWDKAAKLGAQPLTGRELEAAEMWLAQQPKAAPDPTTQQRSYIYESRRRSTKRQRNLLSGVLCLALVIGAMGVFSWFQRNAALEGERKADTALRAAHDAANTMTSDLAGDLQGAVVPQELVRSILDKSIGLQETLTESFPEDSALQQTIIPSQILVGKVLESQNDDEGAKAAYQAALDRALELSLREGASVLIRSYVPLIYSHFGTLHHTRSEYDEASGYFENALAAYDAIATTMPTIGNMGHYRKAETFYFLGGISLQNGEAVKAEGYFEKGLEQYRILQARSNASLQWFEYMPETLADLSDIKRSAGKVDEADRLFAQGILLARALAHEDPNSRRYQLSLGWMLTRQGDLASRRFDVPAVLSAYEEARTVYQSVRSSDPDNAVTINAYVVILGRLGPIYRENGDTARAQTVLQEAVSLKQKINEANPGDISNRADLVFLLRELGFTQATLGHNSIASELFKEALELNTEFKTHKHYKKNAEGEELTLLNGYVDALRLTGELDRAIAMNLEMREAGERFMDVYDLDLPPRVLAVSYANEGIFAYDANDWTKAKAPFEWALVLFEQLFADQDGLTSYGDDLNYVLNMLGKVSANLEQYEDAISYLNRASDISHRMLEIDPTNGTWRHDVFDSQRLIGRALKLQGEVVKAYEKHVAAQELIDALVLEFPTNAAWKVDALAQMDSAAMLAFENDAYELAVTHFSEIMERASLFLQDYPENTQLQFYEKDSREYRALSLAAWSNQQIHGGDYGVAVVTAQNALQFWPDSLVIKVYLANAYLINGNTEQAQTIHLRNKGKIFPNGDVWEDVIQSEFYTLSAAGLKHSAMDEILNAFDR
ncbi:MAG: TIR domain-containing protein [Hyphomicrobiales bacterium]